MPGKGLSKKKRVDYQWKYPKRFLGVVKPTESRPVPSSEPMAHVPVPTTSGKKSIHLIPLGSLQGAVSAFTCYGSPLAVVEDRNQRRGLVSKLSICCSVCGKSSAITDPYQKRDLETNTKSVLTMRAIGKGRAGLETFCGMMGHVASSFPKSIHHSKPEVVCCLTWRARGLLCWCFCRAKEGCAWRPSFWHYCDLDGTWARWGFQSLYGIVVVASWKTEKVLEVEVLNKHCQACATHHGMILPLMNFWIGGRVTMLHTR